jgi:hypothetical protein
VTAHFKGQDMKIPHPPEMIRKELNDILKRAMKKIKNGEPLLLDNPLVVIDTPMNAEEMKKANEMRATAWAHPEGEVVYHILRAILEERTPTPFVRDNLPEDDVIIIARVLRARKKYGTKDKSGRLIKLASANLACQMIASGNFKETPRSKETDKQVKGGAVRKQYDRHQKN